MNTQEKEALSPISLTEFPNSAYKAYRWARRMIKNGDVMLCSGSGLFSTLIQEATGSIWSHVGFILRLEEIDRLMVLESVEPIGVRTVPLSKYLQDYDSNGRGYPGGIAILRHRQFAQKAREEGIKKLLSFAVNLFGYPYDKDEIVKIAARILSSKAPFSPLAYERIKEDREFICSEYVYRCYREIGIEIKWDKRGFIAPSDFVKDENFELICALKKKTIKER